MRSLARTRISNRNRLLRLVWGAAWTLLYRPSPRPLHMWRRTLLRMFGARISTGAHPYPRARIWAPWNLEMGPDSCIADDVDCYSVARVRLGARATISQYSYLCCASHDYLDPTHPLISAPIVVEEDAWIAADVFIGPGVTIGAGAVVGARSTVTKDVAPWMVVAGTPPRLIRERPRRSG
jgi:putative colanic acid biosynthesis acetyltransferase WcaF